MHFDNWNIHHTYEKNWIRNSLILMDGWQFSDNQRGWIIKAGFNERSSTRRFFHFLESCLKSGTPISGSYKLLKNSTFVGFTPNTGHRVCAGNENRFWKEFVSYNLAEIVQCREADSGPNSYEYDAPEMKIDTYCPGWPETERERVGGEALRHG